MLNNRKENLGKFDVKADESIFLSCSLNNHGYRVYNKRLMTVEESIGEDDACEDEQVDIFLKSKFNPKNFSPKNITEVADQSIKPVITGELPKEWRTLENSTLTTSLDKLRKEFLLDIF